MTTRGYMIGYMIDQLEEVSLKAKRRNSLGLMDLSKYCENYFRDILNLIYGWDLEDLNVSGPTEKGLDLGDKNKKIAIQVTTTNTKQKIDKTLKNITDEHLKKYNLFKILIIGDKQNSYSSFTNPKKVNFTVENNIIDICDLQRDICRLDIRVLKELFDLIKSESSIVLVELDLPDKNGNYAVSDDANWEKLPKILEPSFIPFINYIEKEVNQSLSEKDKRIIKEEVSNLLSTLKKIPRLTREFIVNFINNNNEIITDDHFTAAIEVTELDLRYSGDCKPHINILKIQNLLGVADKDDDDGRTMYYYYYMNLSNKSDDVNLSLISFLNEKEIPLKKAFVELNFSDI